MLNRDEVKNKLLREIFEEIDDSDLCAVQKIEIARRFGANTLNGNFEKNVQTIYDSLELELHSNNNFDRNDDTTSQYINLVRAILKRLNIFSDAFIIQSMKEGGIPSSEKKAYIEHLNVACGEMIIAGGFKQTKHYILDQKNDIAKLLLAAEELKKCIKNIQPHVEGLVMGAALKKDQKQTEVFFTHLVNLEIFAGSINVLKTMKKDISEVEYMNELYGPQISGRRDKIGLKVFIQKFSFLLQAIYGDERKLTRSDANIAWIKSALKEFGFDFEDKKIDSAIKSLKTKLPTL